MSDIELNEEEGQNKPKRGLKQKIERIRQKVQDFFANPKKRLIFIISVGAVIIAAVGTGLYIQSHEKTTTSKNEDIKTDDSKVSETLYSAILDGVMTDQESANRHPLGVIVENHPDARPQSGLSKASIVYEAIAEGGITRFLAIFGTNEAEKVGPVRSARTYFVDWAHGYNAFFAHVGGNMDALDKIPKDKILDLDQFRYSGSYWREQSAGLATEHTMYTSTLKLREQAKSNNYPTANNFNILKFKDDPTDTEKANIPEKQKVSVVFSSAQFNVAFDYDKATNSYKRSLAGSPHIDKMSKNQLNPKNVIVMTVKRQPTTTRINEAGYTMTTIGSGTAEIFIDGKEIKGTWKKDSAADRELFYDEAGNEIVFNRGQFWICVIPPEGNVSVQ
ncbi:MAG: DUF3048 domain-containing protein [Patescibacteria group bacterium]